MPNSIFDEPNPNASPDRVRFYDQIAWFTGTSGGPARTLVQYRKSGCSISRATSCQPISGIRPRSGCRIVSLNGSSSAVNSFGDRYDGG